MQRRKSPSPCLCGTCDSACWCVRSGGVSSWGWIPVSNTAVNWLFFPRPVSDFDFHMILNSTMRKLSLSFHPIGLNQMFKLPDDWNVYSDGSHFKFKDPQEKNLNSSTLHNDTAWVINKMVSRVNLKPTIFGD